MAGEFFNELSQLWEEEGLFSRDIDGQLVRLEEATESDYAKQITLMVDGQEVTIEKAKPTKDAQGNVLRDEAGRTIPRDTTIYDAAQKLYVNNELGKTNPIPTLCHREHMRPVGVCRVCCVEIYKKDREGNLQSGGKLVPACHQPVNQGMIVHTIATPETEKSERLKRSVKLLTELLASDHLNRGDSSTHNSPSELGQLSDRMGCETKRFSFRTPPELGLDASSQLITVNHDACILCERCIRGCNEIKGNEIIGRTGKGYDTKIGFDLNQTMEDSNCVSCGECMVSCPTDALTFKKPIQSEWHQELVSSKNGFSVTPEELMSHDLFNSLPYKWLQWNQASIVKRQLKTGEVLCYSGDYGSTAFIINSGEFGIFDPKQPAKIKNDADANGATRSTGILSQLLRPIRGRASSKPQPPAPRTPPVGEPKFRVTPHDLIIGEMTCMNFQPRSATVVAQTDCEVFEIRRNVLFMLQRNAGSREALNKRYRERTLINQINQLDLFSVLSAEERQASIEYLRNRVKLSWVEPGQVIYSEGQTADDIFLLRLGHVKVTQSTAGADRVLTYIRPETSKSFFGEIGVLTQVNQKYGLGMPDIFNGRRSASCSALDHVELVRIPKQDFFHLIETHESLRNRFIELAKERLQADVTKKFQEVSTPKTEFLNQGLFNAQKLLVLDLDSCTRCDECVKACADTHDGVTRLVREGLRFDKYLVASACRSCTDPYCMVGCPVDSIHREGSLEIKIEDHCIGCGLCAKNCPYGNINMAEFDERGNPYKPGVRTAKIVNKATTCDLCSSVGVDASNPQDEVSCVYACPHAAALRMSGPDLLERIQASNAGTNEEYDS